MSINDENEFNIFDAEDAGKSELELEAEAQSVSSEVAFEKRYDESRAFKDIPDEVYEEKDLIKRTRKLSRIGAFNFPDMKGGEELAHPDRSSDNNRRHFFDVLFDRGSGRCPTPYADQFSAKVVSHTGASITAGDCDVEYELSLALAVAGMKNQAHSKVAATYYSFAKNIRRNGLIHSINKRLVPWDGVERTEDVMIKAFKLRDNETNRLILRYFWHSLYMRVTRPGCDASLSIALIGDQDVGKSYFSTIVCEEVMGCKATAVQLDFSAIDRDPTRWLRRMTGHSIIANVGEMKGYRRSEIEAVKSFTTLTSDKFDRKWEGEKDVDRQWVIVADANKYEGFHRDETGNRRFFPFFINQIDPDPEDADQSSPRWEIGLGWKGDIELIRKSVWPIICECHHNIEEFGEKYYFELKAKASRAASVFSQNEMKNGRGVIDDSDDEAALHRVVLACDLITINGTKLKGVVLPNPELDLKWRKHVNNNRNPAAVKRIMDSFGWEFGTYKVDIDGIKRAVKGFYLEGVMQPRHAKMAWIRGIKRGSLKAFIRSIEKGQWHDSDDKTVDEAVNRVVTPDSF